mgnify:CR=1 FL=1
MNEVGNDAKETRTKYRRFIAILLILLLISWVFIINYGIARMKADQKDKKGDIFEIKCDNGCDCDKDGPSHDVKPPKADSDDNKDDNPGTDDGNNDKPGTEDGNNDNNGNDDNNGSDNKGDDTPVDGKQEEIDVSDKNIKWENGSIYQTTTKLNIFENPVYNNEKIIAPTSSNTYEFMVKNGTGYVIDYRLGFVEENPFNINMKYRLRRNGYYVVGSEDEWVSAKDLTSEFENISKGNADNYELDWKWFESDNDTKVGTSNATYELSISITAVDSTIYE